MIFDTRDCALDDSCVLCSRCFHATDHTDHNVSFIIAQQSCGCCDNGDVEAWRILILCPYHHSGEGSPASLVVYAAERRLILWGHVIPSVQNYPHRVPVPAELRESMTRTVAYAVDFVLETLDCSPDETSVPTHEADLRLQPSADPMMKVQYCVVLWNDEKHSFAEVINLLRSLTLTPQEKATEITNRIDDPGREVIEMSTDVPRVLDIAQNIAQIELGVTVRRAYDTFREQEVVAEELLLPRRRCNATTNLPPEVLSIETETSNAVRVTWLYLYHTMLWKKPRLSLKEIYASKSDLSHQHKLTVPAHFANVYPRVIDNYLLVDREAETSIKYFTVELFTVPSAALIVQHYKIVTRILNIITFFLTNQISDRRINYPASNVAEVDVDSEPFKSKRFMPVFSDLRYLCHNEPVQRLITSSSRKFETDGWISVFNMTLSLSRVIKMYGEAFQYATPAKLVAAITTVTHNILMSITLSDERLDRMKFNPITFHEVKFGSVIYSDRTRVTPSCPYSMQSSEGSSQGRFEG
ncbi:hypothetical protein BGW80DRAFT_1459609 [Lactifluus volemus]|nr:hypothetical protein BGW80DRAFT_1459609 [Lactifluus volemus]